ncbi:MAG: NADPH-dependent assimilatory sulfite reductase hemoprotein subunit, partial [Myxococcota bacterium]|nr:NADPH-dependent assimilatory sulfite reductase hemoprotein subunit [Myxococcota bacterium]
TLSNPAKEISKFFGIYKQQERGERGKKSGDYIFMVRIKNPGGGRLTARQWVALDDAADRWADGTLRVTTRQGIQYHHVYGKGLAPLVRHLNREYRPDATLGACGDVNRNVMASAIDDLDPEHRIGALELAREVAEELAPKSSSYFQVFMSDEEGRNAGPMNPTEPLYGEHYLPRKFKIGIAHPRDNATDVLTNDVAFVPVVGEGREDGAVFELWSGGGMGVTHNNPKTAALLALHLGRVRRDQVVEACRAIAILQKEHGERKDRRQARWKYTIRRLGVERVKRELRERFGLALEDAEPGTLPDMQLHLGWNDQRGGGSFLGVPVENGRIKGAKRAAIREAVEGLGLTVVLSPQHDVFLCDVQDRAAVEAIFERHGVPLAPSSAVRANAMACPAKPTCGLAMTEAEGILPVWIDALEKAGYGDLDVMIRMTGCPNGCARPPTAEIGIYGYGKNDHVVLVGGSRRGDRLAHTLYERLPAERMEEALIGIFRAIREHNREGLPPGDFLHGTDPARLREWIGLEVAD